MRIPFTILLLPFFLPVMGLPASNDKVDKGKAPAEEDTHALSVNYYEIEAYESFSGSECTGSVVGRLKVPKSNRAEIHRATTLQATCLRFIIPFPHDCRLYINTDSWTKQFRKEYTIGYTLRFRNPLNSMGVECGLDEQSIY
ncbi:hypothetical protein HHX47_DHR2000347 [Lentinula edodes]|nr:hypothetical protein HHX47_DHR2000347 [Lentinula edodes]